MQKRLQVFISSTYLDLVEERHAAVMAILKAGHFPAGMELFIAGPGTWETIKTWIDDSDIFLLIVGGRYGSVDPDTKTSYTENEYTYALQRKMPTFAIVIQDEWTKQKIVAANGDHAKFVETDNSGKLKDFRDKVMVNLVAKASSLAEIRLAVYESINMFKDSRTDMVGWVRGDQAVSNADALNTILKMQTEIDRLSGENRSLQEKSATSVGDPAHERAKRHLQEKELNFSLQFAPFRENCLQLFAAHREMFTSGVGNHKVAGTNDLEKVLYNLLVPELEMLSLVQREPTGVGYTNTYGLSENGKQFLAKLLVEERYEIDREAKRRRINTSNVRPGSVVAKIEMENS